MNTVLTRDLQVLFVDPSVQDYQNLLHELDSGIQCFVLDNNQDGIEQISKILDNIRQKAANIESTSIFLLTHGYSGGVRLAKSDFNLSSLSQYEKDLQSWFNHENTQYNSLSFCACNVATGDIGKEFIEKIGQITQATILASSSPLGSSLLNGNWHLDYCTTEGVESKLPFSSESRNNYPYILPTLPAVDTIFSINGNASKIDDDEIRLTPDAFSQSGSAFSTARIDFNYDWTFNFAVYLGVSDGGADGIGFVLHNDPRGSSVTGEFGGGLGILNIQKSIGIEFDTWQNPEYGDPVADHTSILLPDTTGLDRLTTIESLSNIEDGQYHNVIVTWNATTKTLSYTLDSVQRGSVVRDVINQDFGGEKLIYFGFAASTGGAKNEHKIRISNFEGRLINSSGNDIINTANASPVIASPTGSPASFTVVENTSIATILADVNSSDAEDGAETNLTYSLSGVDASRFNIDSNGRLTFKAAPDFESPLDSGANNSYDFTVTVTDTEGATDTQDIRIIVANVNDNNPVISTPLGSPATLNVLENTVTVVNVNASDAEDGAETNLTYSLSGTDSSLFVIDSNGNLSFKVAPNFENPQDNGTNNVYDVTVNVTDSGGLSDLRAIQITVINVNESPKANADIAAVAEKSAATINLTNNDTDPDAGTDLEVTALNTTGIKGLASINPDGEGVTYNPNGAFNSLAVGETTTDSFTYTVNDGNGGTNTATVTVTIIGENDQPTANFDAGTVAEDGTTSINLTGNDTDPDGSDDLEVTSVGTLGTLGLVSINPDGEGVTYNPNGVFNNLAVGDTATDTFTYTVSDGNGGTDTATVTVTITGENDQPNLDLDNDGVSGDVDYATLYQPGTPVSIAEAGGSLITDIDGDTLTISIVLDNPLDGASETFSLQPGFTIPGSLSITPITSGISIAPSGSETPTDAEYQAVLEAIRYNNSDMASDRSDRTITITVNDGTGTPNATATATTTINYDTDDDGIADTLDLDDDNDGILDLNEQFVDQFVYAAFTNVGEQQASGQINGINFTYTTTQTVLNITNSMYNHGTFPSEYDVPNVNPTIRNDQASTNQLVFEQPMLNPVLVFSSIGNPLTPVPIEFGAPVEILWSQDVTINSPTSITGAEGFAIVRFNGLFDVIDFQYLADETYVNFAFGASFKQGEDTDGDGIQDYLDLDSDNDGITDNVEAQTTADYIAPTGTDNDGDGLDDAYEGAGNQGLTPVNTDGTDAVDYLDSDSDNDGISDAAERGTGGPTTNATGLSDATTDADGDGLFDVFEGGTPNDGFDVNGDNLTGTTFNLADTDNDVLSDGSDAIARSNDLDYRDNSTEVSITANDANAAEAADNGQFTVTLNQPFSSDTTVNYSISGTASNGTDYTTLTGSVIIPAGATSAPINIAVTDDPLVEQDETVILTLTSATNPKGTVTLGSENTATVNITDTDTALVSISATDAIAAEDINNGQFTVSLTNPSDVDTVISYSIGGDATPGSDYTPLTGTVTILAGNTSATINVSVLDDSLSELDEAVTVTLIAITSGDSDVSINLAQNASTVTILADTDGDNVPDIIDLDDDNDGILDTVEAATAPANGDTDGDGIPDRLDLDSDNDGINDVIEAGHGVTDTDGDGMLDGPVGSDGIPDAVQSSPNSGIVNYALANTDGDGQPDFQDLDSDNDSLSDLIEGGSGGADANNDGVVDGPDTDGDGIQDSVDATPTTYGDGASPALPDADSAANPNTPDYIDVDSNNNGINDIAEAGNGILDPNGDGAIDNITDNDKDGIPDVVDDSDLDGIPDAVDGTPNPAFGGLGEPDSDGDGIANVDDLDDDNDGILDAVEEAGNAIRDTDGDGILDRLDLDSDNDGINDVLEAGHGAPDANGDGILDGPVGSDGIPDSVQASPNDGTVNYGLPANSDSDPIPDFQDLDSDNDSLSDLYEGGSGGPDANNDGVVDGIDSDGDGILDAVDGVPATYGDAGSPALPNADNDLVPNYIDPDSDSDGVNDIDEASNGSLDVNNDGEIDDLADADGDGVPDVIDDSDLDGTPDKTDTTPNAGFGGLGLVDTDGDGVADIADLDDDNDGILDTVEEAGNPDRDTDGDSILDRLDLDADNDGINDLIEAGHGAIDANGDGLVDGNVGANGYVDILETTPDSGEANFAPRNSDNDANPDFQDLDADNDSISDLIEGGSNGADANNDGVVDGPDTDGDGIQDSVDGTPNSFGDSGSPAVPNDDADTTPNYIDPDSNNDGTHDILETGNGVLDGNGDGVIDNATDLDGDGIADVIDDSDNDGTPDAVDTTPNAAFGGLGGPAPDADGDGIANDADLDDDNDGILDSIEEAGDPTRDTDGDGIPDRLDLDSDNDGINDVIEAGHGVTDTDGDGMLDGPIGSDGIPDAVQSSPNSGIVNYALANTDGDGQPDFQDLDSDNDSLSDLVEGGSGGNDSDGDGVVDGPDTDKDGIQDSVDGNPGLYGDGGNFAPQNSDSDPNPDYIDIDSDGNGVDDIDQAGSTILDGNNDGRIDDITDNDNDGIADVIDDSDQDGIPDISDSDPQSFGGLGKADTDGDGILNSEDLDDDNDGILDTVEEAGDIDRDTDGDGILDRLDLDSDNDGINDVLEAGHGAPDANGDGILDGPVGSDGIPDSVQASPNDGTVNYGLPANSDSDPIPDFQDLDSDNDSLSDLYEGGSGGPDANNDGVVDGIDSDGDGILDAVDGVPATYGDAGSPALPNADNDLAPNYIDPDSDGDGVNDIDEASNGGLDVNNDGEIDDLADADGDGVPDVIDDSDLDGTPDKTDTTPNAGFGGLGLVDTDGDGVADIADLDDDNDGILDTVEEAGNPDRDTDGDGILDRLDLDADNDGINDLIEAGHGAIDANGDGLVDGNVGANGYVDILETTPDSGEANFAPRNSDNDANPDFQDLDADNDSISDLIEGGSNGADANNDGVVDGPDTDGDGIQDSVDGTPNSFGDSGSPAVPNDDADTTPNYIDPDSNNDGTHDILETGNGVLDGNGDGVIDNATDLDGDGIADVIDDSDNDGTPDAVDTTPNAAFGGLGGPAPDADGDGIANDADLDDDNDGILDSIEEAGDPTRDTDGDGIPDRLDLDSDNDGINDVIEAGHGVTDTDGDGMLDGPVGANGVDDAVESSPDSGIVDAPVNSDSDAQPDFQDLDADNDGLSDFLEGGALFNGGFDADDNGVIDGPDTDKDGIPDSVDGTPNAYGDSGSPALPDGDSATDPDSPDYRDRTNNENGLNDINPDLDLNNDGEIDDVTDNDNDGIADIIDDSDSDGMVDANPAETDPQSFGGLPATDTDGDGVPDSRDLDDDNDGILDSDEGNGKIDTDGDGIVDSRDLDTDNDGILDVEEAGHSQADIDGDGRVDGPVGNNGLPDTVESTPDSGIPSYTVLDTDGDGIEDFKDLDSDNDGINDVIEGGGQDPDGDGTIHGGGPIVDVDRDGILDVIDPSQGGSPVPVLDTDGDGIENYRDLDSDNDGVKDIVEGGNAAADADGDGRIDGPDADGDGIPDRVDPSLGFGDSGDGTAPDSNGDGIPDFLQPGSNTGSGSQGTGGSDVINGGAGGDIINGLSDDDVLDGGAGDDVINGGSDQDTTVGGSGNDIVNGGSDGDQVNGGDGNDIANGGSGNDLIAGDDGDDIMNGGSGLDTLYGGLGNDILNGGSGDDLIYGGAGSDIIRGSTGNDMLVGGDGSDLLFGGQGDDRFVYESLSEFGDTILDFEIVRDRIDLQGIFNGNAALGSNVQAQQLGLHSLILANTGSGMQQVAMLLNVNASTLDSSNFIF